MNFKQVTLRLLQLDSCDYNKLNVQKKGSYLSSRDTGHNLSHKHAEKDVIYIASGDVNSQNLKRIRFTFKDSVLSKVYFNEGPVEEHEKPTIIDFVEKPIQEEELFGKVKEWLKQPSEKK